MSSALWRISRRAVVRGETLPPYFSRRMGWVDPAHEAHHMNLLILWEALGGRPHVSSDSRDSAPHRGG
jgi:hypothetical protein